MVSVMVPRPEVTGIPTGGIVSRILRRISKGDYLLAIWRAFGVGAQKEKTTFYSRGQ